MKGVIVMRAGRGRGRWSGGEGEGKARWGWMVEMLWCAAGRWWIAWIVETRRRRECRVPRVRVRRGGDPSSRCGLLMF